MKTFASITENYTIKTILEILFLSKTPISDKFAEFLTGYSFSNSGDTFLVQHGQNNSLTLRKTGTSALGSKTFLIDFSNVTLSELLPLASNAVTVYQPEKIYIFQKNNIHFLKHVSLNSQDPKNLALITLLRNLEMSETTIEKDLLHALSGNSQNTFRIEYDWDGNFFLQNQQFKPLFAQNSDSRRQIDIPSINFPQLLPHAIQAFKAHLSSGNFDSYSYSPDILKGLNMKQHLQFNIDFLRELQSQISQDSHSHHNFSMGLAYKPASLHSNSSPPSQSSFPPQNEIDF